VLIIAKAHGSLGAVREEFFKTPQLRGELERIGLTSVDSLALHQVGDRHSLLPLFDALSNRMNSDLHPLLSLEGPRARFAGASAQAMLTLSLADLPVREVLTNLGPSGMGDIPLNANYSATVATHLAMQVVAMLHDPTVGIPRLDPQLDRTIALVRADVGRCQASADAINDADALVQLASGTIPFLTAAELKETWSVRPWISCSEQPAPTKILLALLDALAQRDFDAVGARGIELLITQRNSLSAETQDWVLRAAMLAAIAQHEYADVAKIESDIGKGVVPTPSGAILRNCLVAVADARLREAAAKLQPTTTSNNR